MLNNEYTYNENLKQFHLELINKVHFIGYA